MKIYLLCDSYSMVTEWEKSFDGIADVEIVYDTFSQFMAVGPSVDAVVSPANSFGIMDGGYDLAITHYYGPWLMRRVQEQIAVQHYGEQPVGSAMVVPIDDKQILIHTPTMRSPQRIIDPMVCYWSMRSTMVEALKHGVQSILIPAFGQGTGGVSAQGVAILMRAAYDSVMERKRNKAHPSITEQDLPGIDDRVHTLSADEIPRHLYGGKW